MLSGRRSIRIDVIQPGTPYKSSMSGLVAACQICTVEHRRAVKISELFSLVGVVAPSDASQAWVNEHRAGHRSQRKVQSAYARLLFIKTRQCTSDRQSGVADVG